MNRYFLFLLLALVIIPFVKADISTNIVDAIPLYQNISIDITANATACTSKFYASNGSTLYQNQTFSFTIPDYIHSQKGIYKTKVNCSDGTIYTKTYFVTKNGDLPASGGLSIFIYSLFIISIMGTLVMLIWNMMKLIPRDIGIIEFMISFGLMMLSLISLYLAQIYLIDSFIEDFIVPIIVFVIAVDLVFPLVGFIFSALKRSLEETNKEIDDMERE